MHSGCAVPKNHIITANRNVIESQPTAAVPKTTTKGLRKDQCKNADITRSLFMFGHGQQKQHSAPSTPISSYIPVIIAGLFRRFYSICQSMPFNEHSSLSLCRVIQYAQTTIPFSSFLLTRFFFIVVRRYWVSSRFFSSSSSASEVLFDCALLSDKFIAIGSLNTLRDGCTIKRPCMDIFIPRSSSPSPSSPSDPPRNLESFLFQRWRRRVFSSMAVRVSEGRI